MARHKKSRIVKLVLANEGQELLWMEVDIVSRLIKSTNTGDKMWKKCHTEKKPLEYQPGEEVTIIWPSGKETELIGAVVQKEGGWE